MPKLKKPITLYRLTVSRDRLEFRQPLFVIFKSILCLVFGIFSLSLSIINPDGTHWIGMTIVFILGVIFMVIGSTMLVSINALLAVFDRHKDSYWLRGHTPDKSTTAHTSSYSSRITDIKRIDLVPRSYWSGGGDSSAIYTVIAAELVLNNDSRIKILHYDYADRQAALDDAQTLATFINKPLSDLMDIRPIDSTWGDRDPFGRQE